MTDYKFTVILESQTTEIKATYIVSFAPATGKTLVTYYIYTILFNNDNEYTSDLPQFCDSQSFTNNSYYDEIYNRGVDFTISDALAKGLIKKGTYHVGRIFSVQDEGYTDPYVQVLLVTLVNKSGYNYRATINVPDLGDIAEEDQGNYPVTYTIYPNK